VSKFCAPFCRTPAGFDNNIGNKCQHGRPCIGYPRTYGPPNTQGQRKGALVWSTRHGSRPAADSTSGFRRYAGYGSASGTWRSSTPCDGRRLTAPFCRSRRIRTALCADRVGLSPSTSCRHPLPEARWALTKDEAANDRPLSFVRQFFVAPPLQLIHLRPYAIPLALIRPNSRRSDARGVLSCRHAMHVLSPVIGSVKRSEGAI
jgi:hypothetical protein